MEYKQLVAEGYIRGEGRKGYFVNESCGNVKRNEISSYEFTNDKLVAFPIATPRSAYFNISISLKLSPKARTS